ncbi:MAG: integrase core domain-containing protein, partial [Planctomycetota bacterium]
EKRGIRQVVASPRRPQTLGKIERFWGTLWRECIETAIFLDMADAQRRIGHFIDYYNFQRTHQGIDGLVPADRYFGAGSEVLQTLKKRVAANALELARHGVPKKPFYLTGQVGGKSFSVHAEGERVILKRQGEERQEVDLVSPEEERSAEPAWQQTFPEPLCPNGSPVVEPNEPSAPSLEEPGSSPLDQVLPELGEAFSNESDWDGEGDAP